MTYKEVKEKYDKKQKAWKVHIRMKPTKWQRFWAWVWYLVAFPWVWIWTNIRDWHTAIIFLIICAIVSSEVWVPYLIGVITWGSDLSKWMFGVGSACWIFWAGPGTPFLLICIFLTMAVKALFNKITERKNKDEKIRGDSKQQSVQSVEENR